MKNKLNLNKLPTHVAIIMDGNGTWAKKRGLSRNLGHRKGAIVLKDTVMQASRLGIEYLTVFAFSTENWRRPQEEIDYLLGLPKEFLNNYQNELFSENIRVNWIGSSEKIPEDVIQVIRDYEQKTKNHQGLVFSIAFNYGGRDEILNAVNNILKDGHSEVDETVFAANLYSNLLPDIDLLIRTSGQYRLSNFLLWKLAYSELFFTDVLWPDFDSKNFEKALLEYQKRERRFGGIK